MLREKSNNFCNDLHSQKKFPEPFTTQQSPGLSDKTDSTKADSNLASTCQIQSMDYASNIITIPNP